jgi:hypothetical protein
MRNNKGIKSICPPIVTLRASLIDPGAVLFSLRSKNHYDFRLNCLAPGPIRIVNKPFDSVSKTNRSK